MIDYKVHCELGMIWLCGLNSNKDTKSRKICWGEIPIIGTGFCWGEIPIIVFGLHVHNRKKQPNLTLFTGKQNMGTNYHEPRWARQHT